jgi:hypothetical protein
MTIAQFIEQNDKLLQALGIFIALTVFSSSLPVQLLGYFLSFFFIFATILVWFELWDKFPKTATRSLVFFENTLTLASFGLVVYFLLDFRAIWDRLMPLLIWLIFLSIYSFIVKKYDLFNRVFRVKPGKLKALRYIIGIISIIVFFLLSVIISAFMSIPINSWLEAIRRSMETVP